MMQPTLYDFVVEGNEEVAAGIWRLVIRSGVSLDIQPGQFMELSVPGDGSHILRIPLSFSRADADEGTVELLYAVVGEGTERLSHMQPGDSSTLVGPCGNGWSLPKEPGRALLVAGGIGLPPVAAAARMLAGAGVEMDVIVGSRTGEMVVWDAVGDLTALLGDAGEVVVTTDDGSAGRAGFTTQAMEDLLGWRTYSQVYTCGPTVMMAGVARLAHKAGVACQASLERMMGCGFGACSCCNVGLVAGGYALCCQDGPVFDAEEVAW